MTMKRWNSINQTVESTAGSLSRAHLRNAMEAEASAELSGDEKPLLVARGRVVGCSDIVAGIYGIRREDVLDLTRREMAGEDVDPK